MGGGLKDIAMALGIIASIVGAGMAYGVNTQSLKSTVEKVNSVERVQASQWAKISEAELINREQTIILRQVSENMNRLERSLEKRYSQ